MANTLQANKTGLALGGMIGVFHLCWSLLVASGFAQPLMDFIFRLHRITPVYIILPFDFLSMIELVILTGLLGYVMGYLFALLWNYFQK